MPLIRKNIHEIHSLGMEKGIFSRFISTKLAGYRGPTRIMLRGLG